MSDYSIIADKIKSADAVLIGASNGLSITEGIHLFADNTAFEELFGDLKKKYGIRCLLQGMTAQWPTEEEKWGFWSRLIHHYCGNYKETPVMKNLKAIVGNKDYFIITTNGECHFEMAGFEPEKIYEVEGNWLTMQCSKSCHDFIYPGFQVAEKLATVEKNGQIPSSMIPHCPKCGGAMKIHMEGIGFIPDTNAQQRYHAFLESCHDKKIVILELGIGPRNQLIKVPLMHLAEKEKNATYVTINLGEIYIPSQIKSKSFGIDNYLDIALEQLCEACHQETINCNLSINLKS